jgi:hypothetical protein
MRDVHFVGENDSGVIANVMKGGGGQPATRQEPQHACDVNDCEPQQRTDVQAPAWEAHEHLGDALPGRGVARRFPVAEDEAGSLVRGVVPNLALGQDDEHPTVVANRLHCAIEGCRVVGDALERLDLDQAGGAVPMLDEKVGRVGASVSKLESLRLMPDVRDRRTERGAVDEVPLER